MGEDVLKSISELESFDVSESVLDMRVNYQLGESQDLSAKMKGITKTRLFPLLSSKCLYRLQIEVVV